MSKLSVKNLEVNYKTDDGIVNAVNDVSLNINESSIVGILGESGCGKSTLAKSIVRALPSNARIPTGKIKIGNEDIASMSKKRLREIRWKKIAYVPQSAMGSLDPVYTIQEQLVEAVHTHEVSIDGSQAISRAEEVLNIVGISPSRLSDYPHQLSGGMRQRVLLAMALILEPELIIADEPTTGLDVLLRDRVLGDIESYRQEFGVSVIIVSHDIADVVETSDSISVMYGGKIVEQGPSDSLFKQPIHPYTIGLKNSLPESHTNPDDLITMSMDPPNLISPPNGCQFINKCPYRIDECKESHPEFREAQSGIQTACYRADEADYLRKQAKMVDWNDNTNNS